MSALKCHAGAGHGPAADRGVYGFLCAPCWASVERVILKVRACS